MMNWKRFCFFIIFLLTATSVFAEDSLFPFVAEVIGDHVNVRAGVSENFERLGQLSKGDNIVVVDKQSGWYQVRLPPQFSVFIVDKYIVSENNVTGVVTGDRVNVRSGMDVNRTSLGQLVKDDRVRIVSHKDGWYEIRPPEKIFGWVHDNFLAFKTNDLTVYKATAPKTETVLSVDNLPDVREGVLPISESVVVVPEILVPVTESKSSLSEVMGILQPVGEDAPTDAAYMLVVDGKPAYYLRGFRYMIDDFIYYTVRVQGDPAPGSSSLPIIDVERVEIVL